MLKKDIQDMTLEVFKNNLTNELYNYILIKYGSFEKGLEKYKESALQSNDDGFLSVAGFFNIYMRYEEILDIEEQALIRYHNVNDIQLERVNYYEIFKVNLPRTVSDYNDGNGEGMIAVSNKIGYNFALDDESCGDIFLAKIVADSVYYPELKCGTVIPVETRGTSRAICPIKFLNNYKAITDVELHEILLKASSKRGV